MIPLKTIIYLIKAIGDLRIDQDFFHRCSQVKHMIASCSRDIFLAIDGGIKRNNITEMAKIGAHIVVSGSAIFDGQDVAGNARTMLEALKSWDKNEE